MNLFIFEKCIKQFGLECKLTDNIMVLTIKGS